MNIYNSNFETFKHNIEQLNDESDIELMDYDNSKERELIKLMIKDYLDTKSLAVLEELFRLCEVEVIFNSIWAVDRNIVFRKVISFDLNSVAGVSFIHEIIKQIQLTHVSIFDQLYMICTVKFFKTMKAASEYFDNLIDMVKDVPLLNLDQTIKQKEKFIEAFRQYENIRK